MIRVPRREFTSYAYKLAKKMMPKISETERAALNAGTVGFDKNLFSGNPSLKDLKDYSVKPSPEEQGCNGIMITHTAFLDKEVNELCENINDYKITEDRDFDEGFWNRCKKEGFFGMIIPKKYGGKGFTAHGHSQVITKISTRSGSASATVSVPNSLGPGELLLRYGTEEQKDYFLPRLASGDLKDPKGLLKGVGHEGITIALLERDHPGLEMGKRHDPLVASFMNGTVVGKDIFIPMKSIIGGQTRCGFGWNMLMDCLAEGRSISLPASAVGASKLAVNAVGAYARVRKQFRVPIAEMGGVQEALGRIASEAFILTSAQTLINSMLNNHEQPAVLSAVMKYETTSRSRLVVNDAMDVLGGSGICRGPSNMVGNGYMALPIAITVEGANILTRSMMTFGQGVNRSHPHLIKIINTIEKGDDVKGFTRELKGFLGHFFTNVQRSLTRAISRPRSKSNLQAYYEGQLGRLASNFAVSVDLGLLLGGRLKFEEMVSGRFADAFGTLYLGYACTWYYSQNKHVEGIDAVYELAMENLLKQNQAALVGLSSNFPLPLVGPLMKSLCFPTGTKVYTGPSDKLVKKAATLISTPTGIRELLSQGIFISKDPKDRVRMLNDILPKAIAADKLAAEVKKAKRHFTPDEQALIDQVNEVVNQLVQVDVFEKLGIEKHVGDDYIRPALRNTKFANLKTPVTASA
eukprot:scaffold614_cov157-Ochromonas_danica.AAC.9